MSSEVAHIIKSIIHCQVNLIFVFIAIDTPMCYPKAMTYYRWNPAPSQSIRKPFVALDQQPEVGVYKMEDGTLVRIKWNQTKTNRYAMKATITISERLTELDETVHFDWTYAPELRKLCNEANQVTVGEAIAFGIKHETCMCCGDTLKVKKSVQQGIGPVCIKDFKP